MLLSLAKIIDCPGASVPFDETLDFSGMEFGSQTPVTEPVHASGTVRNTAGVMILTGEVRTRLHCVCDRCAKPFERDFSLPLRAVLTAKLESEENEEEELFELVGDSVDLDEVINTAQGAVPHLRRRPERRSLRLPRRSRSAFCCIAAMAGKELNL